MPRCRLRVSQDIAALSCDTDDMICKVADPPLACIELACEKTGRKVVTVLAELISNPSKERAMLTVPPV